MKRVMAKHAQNKRIAHVSTFPPLRCGIAHFVSDLIAALPAFAHATFPLQYEKKGNGGTFNGSLSALGELAKAISASDCDVLSLQHEFGIWGGHEGENIHAFLDEIRKPILTVLHTTFGPTEKTNIQRDILKRLVRQSSRVVVFTDAAKEAVGQLVRRRSTHIAVVPHGIPHCSYSQPPKQWSMTGRKRPVRLITPGHFRPDKGFGIVIQAIRQLIDTGHKVAYRIVGEPQRQFEDQENYFKRIVSEVESFGLGDIVRIDARYVPVAAQFRAIRWAHAGIFPYQEPLQASSGTVPLVLGAGRPVLCTPFEYARAKADEGESVFVAQGFDVKAVANVIEQFTRVTSYEALTKATYDRTRIWTWPAIGKMFGDLYSQVPL